MITDQMVEAALQAYWGQDHQLDFGVLGALLKAMRAALEAAEGAAWQPIETAPRNGTVIVVTNANREHQVVRVVKWDPDPQFDTHPWVDDEHRGFHYSSANCTHWRPLLAAPKET